MTKHRETQGPVWLAGLVAVVVMAIVLFAPLIIAALGEYPSAWVWGAQALWATLLFVLVQI